MRKFVASSLICMMSATPLFSQDTPSARRRGTGAGYSTRDATVLSMMGWGLGMAVGIAALCGSLHQSSSSSNGDNGGGGSNGHNGH